MSRHAIEVLGLVRGPVQESVPSPPLPADNVLDSGAVLFPGAFDRHGCPLVMFPVDGQDKLSSGLSKAEVVDFISYFLCLHNKKQEKDSLVSVVVDLKQASLPTARFIAETLLLLELHKRTVYSVYIVQPRKKDVVKPLLKLLTPARPHSAPFKKVLLKEVSELSNYIDRSQLTASLGGYLVYCHRSWVAFIKEIDAFLQEFLSVVRRLPSCISTLQALSRLPLPSTSRELQCFCSTNEARFQQLRRELGLDELLKHCEDVMGKLHFPEKEPCYQAMAGTALFTHTSFDMLQNHSRITAAVEKVELLWQQAFSQARLQLQVFQLREDALQIAERMERLLQEKLQPHTVEVAKDAAKAAVLVAHFEASVHTPAVALVRCAEDVIHTLAEIQPSEGQSREPWVQDLETLKNKLLSTAHFTLQTLRAVSNYHHYFNKAHSWYRLVLRENFLQELLSGLGASGGGGIPTQWQRRNWGTIPIWQHKLSTFLKRNPPPHMEELVHLAHLSGVVPDDMVRRAGGQMSERCMTLRKLLMSPGPVDVGQLQLALHWQYEVLRSSHVSPSSADDATNRTARDAPGGPSASSLTKCERGREATALPAAFPSTAVSGTVSAEGKPPSLNSGFNGAGSGHQEAWGGREGTEGLCRPFGTRDSMRPVTSHPQIREENISCVSDPEGHRGESNLSPVGTSSRTSIQIIPNVTKDSLNFEIKVKRSAALPSNPWLSLPVEDLENSYTVTITPNPTPQKTDPQISANLSNRSRDQPTKSDVLSTVQPRGPQTGDWIPHSQSSFVDPELSPICNILSSTITDGEDKSLCDTEELPTLLWDSYDLHDQSQDAVDGVVDKDWDEQEQEGLREVEKILGRADEILEEEENVLAQEAVLEALLRTEDRNHRWPVWDSEDQHGVLSSSALTEAGVLGLEDDLDPADHGDPSGPRSTGSKHETEASEDDRHFTRAGGAAFYSRPDLLTELRTVHVLDELIMEENLKIHELRRCEENPDGKLSGSKPLDTYRSSSMSRERRAFRLQLEKEKREVEKLERSLDKEPCMKKHKDRAKKVVKCSIMEQARIEEEEGRALCDGVLSDSYNRSGRTRSVSLEQSRESSETENIQAESGPGVEEATRHEGLPQGHDLTYSEADLPGYRRTTSDLKEPAEELETQAQGCVCGKKSDRSGAHATGCKTKASLSPEPRPDEGAFDTGGKALAPPAPLSRRASLPVSGHLTEHETPHSTEPLNAAPSSVARDPGSVQPGLKDKSLESLPVNEPLPVSHNILNPNAKERSSSSSSSSSNNSSNNNNHHHAEKCGLSLEPLSEITTEEDNEASVLPACLPQTDFPPAVEIWTPQSILSAPQLPPDRPLEFDPGGRDGARSPEALRISGSGSPGTRAQCHTDTREVMHVKTPIVLDTGSGLMKAGFADRDRPNIVFPTIIGVPKYEEIMNGNLEREIYIGHEAQHMRGVLALKHPIKDGIIRNWDDMEKIWQHTFQQLCVEPEDHPILLTEAAMNPLENRRRMVEIMFECFSVPCAYVAMQAVLALYAAGRSTGVVFDSGDGASHSVPVFEGYCLPHAVQRFPLAGVDVTLQLKKLLQEQGVSMRTTAEVEIVREMKEQCCCVALNYEAELARGGSSCRETYYTMPDGQIITLGTEQFRAPEILFKPELIGQDHCGMHESVFKSILGTDIDLRRCFLGNVVLSGGNTLLPGLPERLKAEIKGLVPADMEENVCVSSPKDRDFSVWSGGAVLASLPTFSSAWIGQEEYAEFGPQIVFRKCF